MDRNLNDTLRNLMSGRRQGPVASAARLLLSGASVGYGLGVRWRNRRFDRTENVVRAAVPVVSIGNLTAGGTGKTPVVAYVASHFRRWGVKVAILSRGYRAAEPARTGAACGSPQNDEALVLEHLCPGVPHLQRPDRVAAAADAVDRLGAELLVLDDGFQHRRLARDLNVVLIDATNPFGYGHLLPRGLLREPVASLRRADIVLLTRADVVDPGTKDGIESTIRRFAPALPIVEVAFPPKALVNAGGQRLQLDELHETPLVAFCGIGNPTGFAATLASAGLRPAEMIPFRDHHHYGPADLDRLSRRAEALGAAAAVTTLKDLVKIRRDTLPGRAATPLWAVETGCELMKNRAALDERLDAFVGQVVIRPAA